MGKIKSEVQEYEEFLDWIKPLTVSIGTKAVAIKFHTSESFVRPVVEDWFNKQNGVQNETSD